MRAAEDAAFARGVEAEALMEQAGHGIAETVSRFFPTPGLCVVFAGKGHNAGDAFVAARLLASTGWEIDLHVAFDAGEVSQLAGAKLRTLRKLAKAAPATSLRSQPIIALDGLLGVGAKLPLRGRISAACGELNRLRTEHNAYSFAIDLPTGLDSDSGEADPDCVVADFTVTIGFAKRGLVADRASNYVGRVEVVELDDLRSDERALETMAAAASLSFLPRRKFDAYKNQFGRVGVVAGSRGFTGAALMCSLGALRAGAGLVELFVPEEIYPVVAAAAAPEVMVKPVSDYRDLLREKIDVWAIGPGLGQSHAAEILELVVSAEAPAIVDADGLNVLAATPEVLNQCRGPRLLTPHPGEMARLFPHGPSARAEIARTFCDQYRATLLFKGSRTIVAERDRPISYNTTGTPGMATGGMGDVLTGVCAALVAQKLSLYDAARSGAWLCGRAAEIAIFNDGASEESLLPSDVLGHLGAAFTDLRSAAGKRYSLGKNRL
jgi:NAD(P)H-hydrate epimerase